MNSIGRERKEMLVVKNVEVAESKVVPSCETCSH